MQKKLRHVICLTLCALLCFSVSAAAMAYGSASYIQRKDAAHNIAEQARSIGLAEDHPIITESRSIWHQAEAQQRADAELIAKVMYGEARGISSETELACIGWCIVNRVDAGYGSIEEVVKAPNQLAYSANYPTVNDCGINLSLLSYDILSRWCFEKASGTAVGRVLPADYLWFGGDGVHNNFRNSYASRSYWDYTLPSPYGR